MPITPEQREQRTLVVRASSADIAWDCAESVVKDPDAVRINRPHDGTEMGNAFHEWARHIESDTQPEGAALAERYKVDADELDKLIAFSMIAERELSKWFAGSETEVAYDFTCVFDCPPYTHLQLKGTIDRQLFVHDERLARQLDYKTGYIDSGYEHQQRSYAFLTVINRPEIDRVYSAKSFVRLGWWDAQEYLRDDLLQWFDDFKLRLKNGIGSFNPSDHCGRCDRLYSCDGAQTYTQKALALVGDPGVQILTVDNKEIVGPELVKTYNTVKFIEKRCAEFKSVLKSQIKEVGSIPTGEKGRVLRIVESKKRGLDAMRAWPILSKHLTSEEINSTCSISLTKCQNVLAAKTSSGKGKARKALVDELQTAGAIKTALTESLKETKEVSK